MRPVTMKRAFAVSAILWASAGSLASGRTQLRAPTWPLSLVRVAGLQSHEAPVEGRVVRHEYPPLEEPVHLFGDVLEHLRDPLTHLVRNAVDHGIEPPDEGTVERAPASP